ncbi:reverse transcriptase domain-containing protein [Tanacetum coccineum]
MLSGYPKEAYPKASDLGKFLIPYGFSELKCKALADLGASINLMPLSVWKELGLPELISTQMTLELANCDICTPKGIARDVFVPVGKFTFPADFVIVDYESDPRVPLILGRPFLRTARALIDVHGEEMILRDGNERLILNMRNDTSSYSNEPHQESINIIDVYKKSDLIWEEFEAYLASDSFPPGNSNPSSPLPPFHNSLSGSTTSSSPSLPISETSDYFLEEFADELAHITFPPGNDDLPFDAESDLRELEYLLNHDPIKEMDSILEDSVDENSLDDNLVDTISEMFTDEHALDYSSPPLWDDYDDELLDLETVNDNTYDDPFDSKEEKIKDSKILIDELDLPGSSDFLPFPECDSVFYEDFSEVDALSSTNNEDKVFNPGILIHENLFDVTNCATPEKNVKKTTNASLILEDFNPPLYELPFHKEVPGLGALLSFSSENEEKVFNPGILTSKRVHTNIPHLDVPCPVVTMADQRTMAELLRAPTEGYAEAIRVSPIELKCKALADLDALRKELQECLVPVGKFTFPADFVIVDYESDPRVPLILGRPFLRTARALIDEFAHELALITFPPGNDDLSFDAESDLKEIEYLLNHDPIKEMDSILEDSVDENSLDDNLDDTISEMFTDEHALDYSSPPLWDDYDDNLFDSEPVNDNPYDDPFYSKEEKIKDSKILIDELDPPRSSDFLPFPECDSVFYEDFSEVDALSSTNNEDNVFNPGILIHENIFEVTNLATPDKNVKKTTNASLILEDSYPPLSLYEIPFHKEVPGLGALLSFSSENKEKVFNPRDFHF